MLQEGAPLLLCLTQWEEKGLRLREGVGLTTQPCHAQMGGFLSSFSLLNTVSTPGLALPSLWAHPA